MVLVLLVTQLPPPDLPFPTMTYPPQVDVWVNHPFVSARLHSDAWPVGTIIRKCNSQLHDEIKMGCTFEDVLQRNDVGVLNSEEDKWAESSS